MAQATHTPAVTRTEVVKPAIITLQLSIEEAQALLAVCRHIGGDATTTRRKHFDNINDALFSAGISKSSSHDFDPKFRSIYFTTPSV